MPNQVTCIKIESLYPWWSNKCQRSCLFRWTSLCSHTHLQRRLKQQKVLAFWWCIRQWVFLKTQDLILVFLLSIKAALSHLEEKEKSFLQCAQKKTAKRERATLGLFFFSLLYMGFVPNKTLSLFNSSVPKLVISQLIRHPFNSK